MILMMRVMSNFITLVSQIKPKINDIIIQNVHADNSWKTGYDIMKLTAAVLCLSVLAVRTAAAPASPHAKVGR